MTDLMQFINANFRGEVQDQYHYWDFDPDMRSATVSDRKSTRLNSSH